MDWIGQKERNLSQIALKHDITFLTVQYPQTEIAKEKIEFVCASRKPVVEFPRRKAHQY